MNQLVVKISDRTKTATCREFLALYGRYQVSFDPVVASGYIVVYRRETGGTSDETADYLYAYAAVSGGSATLRLDTEPLADAFGHLQSGSVVPVDFAVFDESGLAGFGTFQMRVVPPYSVDTPSPRTLDLTLFRGRDGNPGSPGAAGKPGRDGKDGKDGTAARISSVTLVPLEPGGTPRVEIYGPDTGRVIAFHLPTELPVGTEDRLEVAKNLVVGQRNEAGDASGSDVRNVAIGLDCKAKGGSVASGISCEATGAQSRAEGYYCVATGAQAHSEGYKAEAVGQASHAEGIQTCSTGRYSHAEGGGSVAAGDMSHAEGGGGTNAGGSMAHAEGQKTSASGMGSHAEGCSAAAEAQYAHAEGFSTRSRGNFAHAEGHKTDACGAASHAEGFGAVASGDYSHAEGCETSASGDYSHAEGYKCMARAEASHAAGIHSVVDVEATGATAIGNRAHAHHAGAIVLSAESGSSARDSVGNNTVTIYARNGVEGVYVGGEGVKTMNIVQAVLAGVSAERIEALVADAMKDRFAENALRNQTADLRTIGGLFNAVEKIFKALGGSVVG